MYVFTKLTLLTKFVIPNKAPSAWHLPEGAGASDITERQHIVYTLLQTDMQSLSVYCGCHSHFITSLAYTRVCIRERVNDSCQSPISEVLSFR